MKGGSGRDTEEFTPTCGFEIFHEKFPEKRTQIQYLLLTSKLFSFLLVLHLKKCFYHMLGACRCILDLEGKKKKEFLQLGLELPSARKKMGEKIKRGGPGSE